MTVTKEMALRQIAEQDDTELMLDPTWAKRVAAAAPPQPAPQPVAVKPLEWDHEAVKGFACSRVGVLSYTIMLSVNRVYGIPGEHDGAAQFATEAEAKAAAQADYERRILSALTTPPAARPFEAVFHGLNEALSVSEVHARMIAADQRVKALEEAANNVISSASDTYRKRNGKIATLEDDSGEKSWIVSYEAFEDLRAALKGGEA